MNRRQFLASAGVGATALPGGCLGDGGDGDGGDDGGSDDRGGDDGSDVDNPLDGEWALRARVTNEDDDPRQWRIESRSQDRHSIAAASGTLPPGEEWELEFSGLLFDEQREVHVESEAGSVSEPWDTTECGRLFAEVAIVDGAPTLEAGCRDE